MQTSDPLAGTNCPFFIKYQVGGDAQFKDDVAANRRGTWRLVEFHEIHNHVLDGGKRKWSIGMRRMAEWFQSDNMRVNNSLRDNSMSDARFGGAGSSIVNQMNRSTRNANK